MHWQLGDLEFMLACTPMHSLPFSSQSLNFSFLQEATAMVLALSPAKME